MVCDSAVFCQPPSAQNDDGRYGRRRGRGGLRFARAAVSARGVRRAVSGAAGACSGRAARRAAVGLFPEPRFRIDLAVILVQLALLQHGADNVELHLRDLALQGDLALRVQVDLQHDAAEPRLLRLHAVAPGDEPAELLGFIVRDLRRTRLADELVAEGVEIALAVELPRQRLRRADVADLCDGLVERIDRALLDRALFPDCLLYTSDAADE